MAVLRARVSASAIGASGQALTTRLRLTLRERGIDDLARDADAALITDDDGRVVGVAPSATAPQLTIRARRGVVLASGGFDHNLAMRERYQPGISQDWSLGAATNVGRRRSSPARRSAPPPI